MTTRSGLVKKERESLEKSLLERVDAFERNVFDIFTQLQVYVRRIARTRDEADILAKMFLKLAEAETISKSFRNGVISFACHFSTVQDYRNAEIERLEKRVISEMTSYGEACKTVRESIKKIFSAKESESLTTTSAPPAATGSKIFASALPQLHAIQVDRFEEKKLSDLKRLFCEMVKIEMLFHAKAIEILSQGFTAVNGMNESDDLNEFRRVFKLSTFLPSSDHSLEANMMQSSLSNLSLSRFSVSDASSVGKAGGSGTDSHTTESHPDQSSGSDDDDLSVSIKKK